ncbi:MAG: DMT family transporter [Xanthomonadaceae bacterium]|nr:DMT family transporter [Xanthomonadaceae bacterium]
MRQIDLFSLLALSVIWGGSFIFQRIAVPDVGVFAVASSRVAIGAVILWIYTTSTRKQLHWSKNWKHYAVVGICNLAAPMFLFSYGAKFLPSAYLAILNATVPFWTAILGAAIYRERITSRALFGIGLGILGVIWMTRAGGLEFSLGTTLAFLGCSFAALSYGFTANYVKCFASTVPTLNLTTGGMLIATAILLPLGLANLPNHLPTLKTTLSLLTLSIVCTAIAFLIFYNLVQKIGMNRAVLVTFLVPVFGMSFGVIFLGEMIQPAMIMGATLIFIGLRVIFTEKKA